MTATITQIEALLGCVEALKQIDRADCKDELVWKAIVAAQGTAEGVLRDGSLRENMIERRLRQIINHTPDQYCPAWFAADALYYFTGKEEYASLADSLTAPSAAQSAVVAQNFYDLVTLGLSSIKQDYSPECLQMASTESYVEDAVVTLVKAGWRPTGDKSHERAADYIDSKPSIAAPAEVEQFDPVEGDLLPAVGEKVLIHLARQDDWIEHTVTGYYVWPAHPHQVKPGQKDAHRVFVRVKDEQGYDNARLLSEVRRAAIATGEKQS